MTPTGTTEADVIRWVGVAVGLIGAVVAGSEGVSLIVAHVSARLQPGLRWIQVHLARWVPFLRRSATVLAGTAHVSATANAVGTLTVGYSWDESASVESKVRILHGYVENLSSRLEVLEKIGVERHEGLLRRFSELSEELRKVAGDLRAQLTIEKQAAARVDARGLPLVGIGILLSGVPDGLARIAVVGWIFVGLAVLSLIVVTDLLIRSRSSYPQTS